MPAFLVTGAAGEGKTHAAIARVKASIERNPFGKVWVLLPTDLQIAAFRVRLLRELDDLGAGTHFGIEFFDFYSLYARLLEIAGTPQRRVKETARFRILRHVLDQSKHNLRHFRSIAGTPGFVAQVAEFIKELKQAGIRPETFDAIVRTPKDHDLALIYSAYQTFLRGRNLVDSDGEGWLAQAQLETTVGPILDVDLLVVDGYDQFNLVQANLLAQLATRLRHVFLTLTYQPERAETAHRRFAQTRDRLLQTGTWTETRLGERIGVPKTKARSSTGPEVSGSYTVKNGDGESISAHHASPLRSGNGSSREEINHEPTLQRLARQLFNTRPAQAVNDSALTMIEAPDRRREVQGVLRRVKRLLRTGAPPDQVAIVSRDLEAYMPYFLETIPTYGIPVMTRHGSPLAENPAIGAFLALVELHARDFPRRATIDALRSPYLVCPDLNLSQIAALDRVSRGHIVVRGRRNWLDAITWAGQMPPNEDGDYPAGAMKPEESETLRISAERFFARITPAAQATARDYARWLEGLIGSDAEFLPSPPAPLPQGEGSENAEEGVTEPQGNFRLLERIRASTDPTIVARDMLALQCLKRVFLEVLTAHELIDAWSPITWETFWLDLRIAIDNALVSAERTSNRLGRVLLASIYEARGLAHDHVFVIGLAEGEFPARVSEDTLYIDAERRQFTAQNLPIRTRAEEADESSLFYEVISLARQSLTLSRPYTDDKGNLWPASPYWHAVRAVIEIKPEHLKMSAVPTLDEASCFSEVLVALTQGLSDSPQEQTSLPGPLSASSEGELRHEGDSQNALAAHNWLVEQADLAPHWLNALRCRQIELHRASTIASHDAYTGYLSDPALVAIIGEMPGPDRLWSASQFNEYGTCPYKFFARRMLRLEAIKEPEEGLDQFQFGSVIHEILEHSYRQITSEQLPITEQNRERAIAILNEVCESLLSSAPQRHGFRPTATWLQEQVVLRRKLRTLIELDFSDESPALKVLPGERYAYLQELRFGYEDQQMVAIEGEAGPLRVRGAIDRVDIADGQMVVIDYKTGSTKIPPDEMVAGRNVQMMLYILAARQVIGDDAVRGGAFWHVGTNTLSVPVFADDTRIEDARESLHERIALGRQGVFVNVPSKMVDGEHCSRHCEFSQLCRMDRASGRKEIRSGSHQ
jgi:ATP-dependent helicase/nuclease subunit B